MLCLLLLPTAMGLVTTMPSTKKALTVQKAAPLFMEAERKYGQQLAAAAALSAALTVGVVMSAPPVAIPGSSSKWDKREQKVLATLRESPRYPVTQHIKTFTPPKDFTPVIDIDDLPASKETLGIALGVAPFGLAIAGLFAKASQIFKRFRFKKQINQL